jgi:hypothetical protein
MTVPTRFQFSLRTLVEAVMMCAIVLATVSTFGLEVVFGCTGLALACGFVVLLAVALIPLDSTVSHLHNWTLFIFTILLFGALAFGFRLFDSAINQPHPDYLSSGSQVTNAWLSRAMTGAAAAAPLTAIVMLIPIVIHWESRTSHPRDRAYYPQLANVWRGLGLFRVRLVLIVGGLLVLLYYAHTVIEVRSAQQHCGLVWPPPRVWISCHLLWGLLWLADSASRPNRGMAKVAVGYLGITFLFLLLFGFGTIGV